MKVIISHDVSFDDSSFPFSILHRNIDLQSISELFDNDSSSAVGPSRPPRRLILCIGPAPTEVQVPSSADTGSSSYDTARSEITAIDEPNTSSEDPPPSSTRPGQEGP